MAHRNVILLLFLIERLQNTHDMCRQSSQIYHLSPLLPLSPPQTRIPKRRLENPNRSFHPILHLHHKRSRRVHRVWIPQAAPNPLKCQMLASTPTIVRWPILFIYHQAHFTMIHPLQLQPEFPHLSIAHLHHPFDPKKHP